MADTIRWNDAAIKRLPLHPAVQAVLRRKLEAMTAHARAVVRVDTGELRDSTGYASTGDGGYRFGQGAEHAPPNEFGTRNMAARPSLRSAVAVGRRS